MKAVCRLCGTEAPDAVDLVSVTRKTCDCGSTLFAASGRLHDLDEAGSISHDDQARYPFLKLPLT